MTEDEAKTKWCPQTRVRWGDESASANRDHRGGWGEAECCIASACMAWRWYKVKKERPGADPLGRNYYYKCPSTTNGYCGLAGKVKA